MKIINNSLLDQISEQAKQSERLRMNYNFHSHLEDKLHRMLNALEPETDIPIHRHSNPDRDEAYIVLRGSILVSFYNEKGMITEQVEIDPKKGVYGVDIPAGRWHNLEVLEENTVIYEVKEGPYVPLGADNIQAK